MKTKKKEEKKKQVGDATLIQHKAMFHQNNFLKRFHPKWG